MDALTIGQNIIHASQKSTPITQNHHSDHVSIAQADRTGILIDLNTATQLASHEPKDMDISEYNNKYYQDLALINPFLLSHTNSHSNTNTDSIDTTKISPSNNELQLAQTTASGNFFRCKLS